MRRRNASRDAAGYTLIDVLITAIIVGVFAAVVTGASRFVAVATASLRDRARTTMELRMATEYLRQDLGGAAAVTTRQDGGFKIVREEDVARLAGSWLNGSDAGIEYVRRNDRLVRTELASGAEIVAAVTVTGLSAMDTATDEVSIAVTAGTGPEARTVTLVWREP